MKARMMSEIDAASITYSSEKNLLAYWGMLFVYSEYGRCSIFGDRLLISAPSLSLSL